jgi:hypothetical protein
VFVQIINVLLVRNVQGDDITKSNLLPVNEWHSGVREPSVSSVLFLVVPQVLMVHFDLV